MLEKIELKQRRLNIINGELNPQLILGFEDTIITYVVPTGNLRTVNFTTPTKHKNNLLMIMILNNSSNTGDKSFNFDSTHKLPGDVNALTIPGGGVVKLLGTIINGSTLWIYAEDSYI